MPKFIGEDDWSVVREAPGGLKTMSDIRARCRERLAELASEECRHRYTEFVSCVPRLEGEQWVNYQTIRCQECGKEQVSRSGRNRQGLHWTATDTPWH